MKRFLLFLLLSISLTANAFQGHVVAVHDGDSLTIINENNKREVIRVHRIDAPEIHYYNKGKLIPTQPYAIESRDALASLCLDVDAIIIRKGYSYGRTVATINCRGTSVADYQIDNGNAWVYKYTSLRYLRAKQVTAKANRIGLWGQPYVEPILWRKGQREGIM
jgi:micrococcal nuclease